jgi:DNA-binding NarL/FixJ family response regulator
MITFVLADRSNIIRYGLRSLLDGHSDFRILAEAAGGWETIQCVSQIRPNVLIMDWGMARRGNMEVLRRVQMKSPSTKIILFSLDISESQFSSTDESSDVELIYSNSIGSEVMRLIREGNTRPPCLVALTPTKSLRPARSPVDLAVAAAQ